MTLATFLQRFKVVRRIGNGHEAFVPCPMPAHTDEEPSLHVTEEDGKILLHCFAGCKTKQIVAALGLTLADLFVEPRASATARLTLDAFAAAKGLPVDFLREQGVEETTRGVRFVYRLSDGSRAARHQQRKSLEHVARWSTWDGPPGQDVVAYGLWRLDDAREQGELHLVEGTSDTLTGWLHHIPTLGIPGADMAKVLSAEALAGIEALWIVKEPGRSGETFVSGIAKRLRECAWAGVARVVTLDVKDLNELHLTEGEHFAFALELAKAAAVPLEALVAATAPESVAAPMPATPTTDRSERPACPLTDLGNSERFVRQHGENVRYVYDWKTWFRWDGKRWARDPGDGVARLMKQTVKAFYRDVATARTVEERNQLFAHAVRSESEAGIRHALELARSDLAITPEELDRDPWLLNCPNGTLELRTQTLREPRRGDYLTKLTAAPYEPSAHHATWTAFLETALPDAEMRAFAQRFAGHALTGDISEEVLLFAHGPTAGGKTTFLESLRRTWGEYGASAEFSTFVSHKHDDRPREDVARLAGVRLCTSTEPRQGAKLAEGLVKTLTGGDTITARRLYQNSVEFVLQCKILWAGNHRPRASASDEAFWRRVREVPFPLSLPKDRRDPDVKKTLTDPAKAGPAILAWAVQGLVAWLAHGLGTPRAVEQATCAYRESMDPLSDFLAECCSLGPGLSVTARTLRDAYETFCRERGERSPLTGRAWAEALRARGCTDGKGTGGVRVWHGIDIRLIEPELPETTFDEPGANDLPF